MLGVVAVHIAVASVPVALGVVAVHTPEADSLKAPGVVAVHTPEAVVPLALGVVAARIDDPFLSPVPVMIVVWVRVFAAEVVMPPVYRKARKMTPLRRFYCHNNNKT